MKIYSYTTEHGRRSRILSLLIKIRILTCVEYLFQAQINVSSSTHANFCKTITIFTAGYSVNDYMSSIFYKETFFMLKIVFPICCGIDIHKRFVVATIASTDMNNVTTCETATLLLLIVTSLNSNLGYWIIIVNMSVCNLLVNIRFLSLTSLQILVILRLQIQSMLKLLTVRNPIKRILFGLLTSTNMVLFIDALFHLLI